MDLFAKIVDLFTEIVDLFPQEGGSSEPPVATGLYVVANASYFAMHFTELNFIQYLLKYAKSKFEK